MSPTLRDSMNRLEERIERRLKELRRDMNSKFKDFEQKGNARHKEIEKDLNKINNHFLTQESYEKGLKDASVEGKIKSGEIRIPNEVWKLFVKFVGIIATVVGIVALLLGVTNGG